MAAQGTISITRKTRARFIALWRARGFGSLRLKWQRPQVGGDGVKNERAKQSPTKTRSCRKLPKLKRTTLITSLQRSPRHLPAIPPDADEATTETSFPALDAAAFIELSDVTVVTEFAADPPPKAEAEQDSPSLTEETAVPERTARPRSQGLYRSHERRPGHRLGLGSERTGAARHDRHQAGRGDAIAGCGERIPRGSRSGGDR